MIFLSVGRSGAGDGRVSAYPSPVITMETILLAYLPADDERKRRDGATTGGLRPPTPTSRRRSKGGRNPTHIK
jgi:hypothetical protein